MRICVHRVLHRLRTLRLNGAPISDDALRGLTGLTALRSLSLLGCPSITDRGLRDAVVPLSQHSLAQVDVRWCPNITARSKVS